LESACEYLHGRQVKPASRHRFWNKAAGPDQRF
jgi:hypothetical protein